ncbi:MAG: alpha/beta hydrolase [Bacteroidetes bacterium]|nr:alpha/beta hydrolase [Bacteroidota bacterium]
MKNKILFNVISFFIVIILVGCNKTENKNELKLVEEWDKVFTKSEKVTHRKVTFKNHFGITLVADLYEPKEYKDKLPAIAVSGPFGAVKEQVSGFYAQEMAERGILAIAFDPSYTGESSGEPRGINSPDINTEDFQAAIDYLTTLDNVDDSKIGIIGICGFGGYALNAAGIDTRIKATAIITMYDMSRVYANDYFDENDNEEARFNKRKTLSEQRTMDAKEGKYRRTIGFPKEAPQDAPQFLKDYINFYETSLGYHKRSIGSNGGWVAQTFTSLQNTKLLAYSNEIRTPVLMIHGEDAHSLYFAKTAFKNLTGDNKELMILPGVNHCDLYYKKDIIPFDKIERFFKDNLK